MIQSISGLDEFDHTRQEWDALYKMSGINSLFLTHQWLSNWIKHFGNDRWVALLVRAPGNGSVLAATVLRGSARGVGFIERGHLHCRGVLQVRNNAVPLEEILAYIRKVYSPRVVLLSQYPQESEFLKRAKLSVDGNWFILEKSPLSMRRIILGGVFESYLLSKNKKVRHELRRKLRRLEKEGPSYLRRLDVPSQLFELFSIIDDIERDSWKFHNGTAIISSEAELNFYKDVFKMYSYSSRARAYVLYTDKIPISYALGIIENGTYYVLKTSYKDSYANVSPGTVLFLRVIEELCSNNETISTIELLGADARWKEQLSTHASMFCTYAFYSRGLIPFLYILSYKYLKPAIERLPLNWVISRKEIDTANRR